MQMIAQMTWTVLVKIMIVVDVLEEVYEMDSMYHS